MQVTEVQIIPVKPQDGLIAFASCILNEAYYIGSIAVYTKLDGSYHLVFPSKKVGPRNLHYHHPIRREAQQAIEEAVTRRMNEVYRF